MTKRTRLLQYWGSLSNYDDDDDDDNNVKKKNRFNDQNNSSACAPRFLVQFFFTFTARLRRETS